MKKNKIIVFVIAALFVTIILTVTLNVTHIWRDYKYRVFAAHHLELSNGYKSLFWFDDVTNYRNVYLVELVQQKSHYDKIFIVMGGQHLKDTKKQLQDIYS